MVQTILLKLISISQKNDKLKKTPLSTVSHYLSGLHGVIPISPEDHLEEPIDVIKQAWRYTGGFLAAIIAGKMTGNSLAAGLGAAIGTGIGSSLASLYEAHPEALAILNYITEYIEKNLLENKKVTLSGEDSEEYLKLTHPDTKETIAFKYTYPTTTEKKQYIISFDYTYERYKKGTT